MQLNKIHIIMIIVIILIFLTYTFIILKDKSDLDKDLIKKIADNEVNKNDSNEVKALKLMAYVYNHSNGDCVTHSFFYERLLTSQRIPNRHVVLRCEGLCSHATTQVYINKTWTFYDSLYNKEMTQKNYETMNLTNAFTHINCVDGYCSNINKITLIYTLLTNEVIYGKKV